MTGLVYPRIKKSSPRRNALNILLMIITCIGYLFIGCNRVTQYHIKKIFFDEVPPLEQPDSSSIFLTSQDQGIQMDSTVASRPIWTFHPASGKNECMTCHNINQSYALVEEAETLCWNCHKQLSDEFIHAPVEAGECQSCHDPHGTPTQHLLTMAGKELCFQCHEEEIVLSDEHDGIGDVVCYECHSPHASNNEYLLR